MCYLVFLRLLVNYNTLELPVSPSSAKLFRNIGDFGAKNYYADHRTVDTTQLFVATKTFKANSFTEQVAVQGIPPRLLENVGTSLYVYY